MTDTTRPEPSMMRWIATLEPLLDRLQRTQAALNQALGQETGFAFYYDGQKETTGAESRALAAKHWSRWDYVDPEHRVRNRVGLLGVSEHTLALAESLNAAKEQWASAHGAIRQEAGLINGQISSRQASTQMRTLLSRLGLPNLDLKASDRKIPLIPGPVHQLNWYEHCSAPSERRSIAHVLQDLEQAKQYADDQELGMIEADIVRLQTVPSDTPVSYRSRGAVRSIRFRARYLIGEKRRSMDQQYAVNPILYCDNGLSLTPALSLFEKEEGPARHCGVARVSDEPVSRVHRVPHYYWYLPAKKKTAPAPKTPHNPYAATAFPSLWISFRKTPTGRSPTISFQRLDKTSTRFGIARSGLVKAWEQAAIAYAQDRGVAVSTVLEAQPTQEQLSKAHQWALENT